MGLLDGIRSYFRENEQTLSEQAAELDRQRRGNQFGNLPEEMEEMPPEDVADEFARMEQQTRLEFIQNGHISREKWTEMITMIKSNPKQQSFWGFDGSQVNIQDDVAVCECHEEVTRTWTVSKGTQKTIGQTQGTSETSKTEAGVKMGGSGAAGVPGVGNINATGEVSAKKGWTQGETHQDITQASDTMNRTQTIHSCRVESTDSTLSRQAFLQTGNVYIGQQYDKTETENDLIDDWEMDVEPSVFG